MGMRVGITTDPDRRLKEWQSQYPTLYNWQILYSGLTHAQAQALENGYISRGYEGHPGGEIDTRALYCVYTFSY